MTKALGFLTGVCLTAAVFTLMLGGLPYRQSEEASPAAAARDAQSLDGVESAVGEVTLDVETMPANATVAADKDGSVNSAPSVAGLIEAATEVADSTTPLLAPHVQDDTGQPSLSALPPRVNQDTTVEAQAVATREESIDSPAPDRAGLDDTGNSDATRSHIFWRPFRSEWAARGFAGRMSSATQITIEAVEVGSGSYRAAFDYQDENQRLERIERIESITGLQLE